MRSEAWVADDRGKKMATRHKWSPKRLVSLIWDFTGGFFFGKRPSRQVEAFRKCSDEDLVRLYGHLPPRPQPDDYAVDDLMEDVNKIRETGLPIAD